MMMVSLVSLCVFLVSICIAILLILLRVMIWLFSYTLLFFWVIIIYLTCFGFYCDTMTLLELKFKLFLDWLFANSENLLKRGVAYLTLDVPCSVIINIFFFSWVKVEVFSYFYYVDSEEFVIMTFSLISSFQFFSFFAGVWRIHEPSVGWSWRSEHQEEHQKTTWWVFFIPGLALW